MPGLRPSAERSAASPTSASRAGRPTRLTKSRTARQLPNAYAGDRDEHHRGCRRDREPNPETWRIIGEPNVAFARVQRHARIREVGGDDAAGLAIHRGRPARVVSL